MTILQRMTGWSLAGLTASLLLSTSAGAADIAAASRIDAVTVFPSLATVTRIVEAEVPAGSHTLVVSGLPQALDPQSLRIEGVWERAASDRIHRVEKPAVAGLATAVR